MTPLARFYLSLATLPPDKARRIVAIACGDKPALVQKRDKLEKDFHGAIVRVLKFAKHDTLRKVQRFLNFNQPIKGQEEGPLHPDSLKVMFDLHEWERDFFEMVREEESAIVAKAATQSRAEVGFHDPWKVPAADSLRFLAQRRNLLSKVPREIFDTIMDEISEGMNKGESIRDLAKRISATFDEIGKGRATVIAQTETAAAYSFSSDKAYRAAGIKYKKWLHSATTLEPFGEPRPDHLEIDGLIVPIDEPYPVGNPRLMYPHADNGSAEDVINCFLPGTLVSGRFVAGLKAFYSGKVWRIVTANGHTLSVTPNHPILTLRGWIMAKHLAKGDTLFSTSSNVHLSTQGNVDDKHRPTRIEDVFQAFASDGARFKIRRTDSDLYGDGRFCDNYIDIVSSDCHLQNCIETSIDQTGSNFPFVFPDSILSHLPHFSTSNDDVSTVTLATASRMGFLNELTSFIKSGISHQHIHRIGPAADWDSIRFEGSKNRRPTDTNFARKLIEAHPTEITRDQVINIETFRYDGHIYDLQTDVGFLIAQNIVSSNCGCISVAATEEEYRRQESA